MIDYKEYKEMGKFRYLPKIGETSVFDIVEVKSVNDGDPKWHFKQRETLTLEDGTEAEAEKNLGYHVECKLSDGKILSVTSLGAFIQVFVKNEINDGDHIEVSHKGKGEWEIVKLADQVEEI